MIIPANTANSFPIIRIINPYGEDHIKPIRLGRTSGKRQILTVRVNAEGAVVSREGSSAVYAALAARPFAPHIKAILAGLAEWTPPAAPAPAAPAPAAPAPAAPAPAAPAPAPAAPAKKK